MAHDIETWINEALANTGVSAQRLPPDIAQGIVREARSRFVTGNPRVWWESLVKESSQYDSRQHGLAEVLPAHTGECWLIPETEDDLQLVYIVKVTEVQRLVNDCPFLEYYLVDLNFDWLVAESDHNIFFVCRAAK